jgi:hypothetical protein
VGDIDFQKKCIGTMKDISESQGRTVFFVSHNMGAIQRLCTKCLLLEDGRLSAYGDTSNTVGRYLSSNPGNIQPNECIDVSYMARTGTGEARFVGISYSSLNETVDFQPYSEGPLEFQLAIVSDSHRSVGSIAVTLYSLSGEKLVNADSISHGRIINLRQGVNRLMLRIEKLYLKPGVYRLGLWLANPVDANTTGIAFDHVQSAFEIEVVDLNSRIQRLGTNPNSDGVVSCEFELLEIT